MGRKQIQIEDRVNPLPTIVGVSVILGIVAFLGFATPQGSSDAPEALTQQPSPPAEELLTQEATTAPQTEPQTVASLEKKLATEQEPARIGKLLQQHAIQEEVVRRSSGSDEGIPKSTSVRDPLNERGNFSVLPFGVDAVDRCERSCSGSESCLLNCRRLVAGEYARRVLPKDPIPQDVARETIADCRQAGWSGSVPLSAEEKEVLAGLLELPDEFERLGLMTRFKAATPFLGRLSRERINPMGEFLCVFEALTTTELAIVTAAETGDSHSEMFYRDVERELATALQWARGKVTAEYGV